MGVGVVLVLLGQLWPERVPKTMWTEEQATERTKALLKGHDARHRKAEQENRAKSAPGHDAQGAHSHSREISDEEYNAAEAKFKNSNQDIERARSSASLPARILFWGGIFAATVGLACYGYERVSQS
jgi:hypothetical protein